MSSTPSLRKRGGAKKDVAELAPAEASARQDTPVSVKAATKPPSEWDYWVGMFVMTALAFVTRFWMINYPDEVVFDEVHFGKVCYVSPCESISF
jgi:dolichyl-phosphate-mannose-protein mannosyltransferase